MWKKARLSVTQVEAVSLGSRKAVRSLFGAQQRRQAPLILVQALRSVVSEDVLARDSAGRGSESARLEPQHFLEKSWGPTYFEDIVPKMPRVYQRAIEDNPDFKLPPLRKNVEEPKWRRGMRIVLDNDRKLSGLKSVASQDHVEGLGRKTIVAFSSRMTRHMVKRCSPEFKWAGKGLLICGTKMGSFCKHCRITGPTWKRKLAELERKKNPSPQELDGLGKARRQVAKFEVHLLQAEVAYFWLTKVRLLMVREPSLLREVRDGRDGLRDREGLRVCRRQVPGHPHGGEGRWCIGWSAAMGRGSSLPEESIGRRGGW